MQLSISTPSPCFSSYIPPPFPSLYSFLPLLSFKLFPTFQNFSSFLQIQLHRFTAGELSKLFRPNFIECCSVVSNIHHKSRFKDLKTLKTEIPTRYSQTIPKIGIKGKAHHQKCCIQIKLHSQGHIIYCKGKLRNCTEVS